ncbi:UNVERIFIED_CONTAM: hypothetical protein NCL1_49013 [Trichonephila clavipes]
MALHLQQDMGFRRQILFLLLVDERGKAGEKIFILYITIQKEVDVAKSRRQLLINFL